MTSKNMLKNMMFPLDTKAMMIRANQLLLSLQDDMENIPKHVIGEFVGLINTAVIARSSINPAFNHLAALCQADLFGALFLIASSAYAMAQRDSINLNSLISDR